MRCLNVVEAMCGRAGRHGRVLALTAVGGMALVAGAQIQVPQTGQLFDASNQMGGTRYNSPRPQSPLIMGNSVVYGTVRSGMAFQGRTTISDPTAFRGPMFSSALSAFQRDSVSVADAARPYPMIGAPYYDPSLTVPTVGFLTGQFLPRTPQPGRLQPVQNFGPVSTARPQPYGPVAPPDVVASSEALSAQITGLVPGELSSAIFGPPQRPVQTAIPQVQPPIIEPGLRGPEAIRERTGVNWTGPRVEEVPGARPPLGTPLEMVRQQGVRRFPIEPGQAPLPGQRPPGQTPQLGPGQTPQLQPGLEPEKPLTFGPVVPGPAGEEGRPPLALGPVLPPGPAGQTVAQRMRLGETRPPGVVAVTPTLRDRSVLPGYDVFNDMQLALALTGNPTADWFGEMQKAIREDPVAAGMLREQAELDSQQFVQKMFDSPIQTFHGRGESPKNNEILRAESLLDIGHYFEAARRYDAAHRLDPLDPLPLIGKGNALLAAGEYASATVALIQGFERYPELSRFQLDLPELIGGREIIDIRRADIMRMLEGKDDPRLRFLLGYLEYYSGDKALHESALRNFDDAATLDTSGSIISRFSQLLRHEGTTPPPKLPGQTPLVPEGRPERPATPAWPGERSPLEPLPPVTPDENTPPQTGEPG